MIVLNQDQANNVVVTLSENTTLTGIVEYLWILTNDDTNESVYFVATDTSTNEFRYNQFSITLTQGIEDPYSGIITLNPNGSWKYIVRQQNVTSPSNLDPDLSGDIVEQGRVLVVGDTMPTRIQHTSTDNETNIVYES